MHIKNFDLKTAGAKTGGKRKEQRGGYQTQMGSLCRVPLNFERVLSACAEQQRRGWYVRSTPRKEKVQVQQSSPFSLVVLCIEYTVKSSASSVKYYSVFLFVILKSIIKLIINISWDWILVNIKELCDLRPCCIFVVQLGLKHP